MLEYQVPIGAVYLSLQRNYNLGLDAWTRGMKRGIAWEVSLKREWVANRYLTKDVGWLHKEEEILFFKIVIIKVTGHYEN